MISALHATAGIVSLAVSDRIATCPNPLTSVGAVRVTASVNAVLRYEH